MSTENHDGTGGHTPLTPPPANATTTAAASSDATAGVTAGQEAAPSGGVGSTSGARTVAIITAVVGGLALLGAGGTAAAAAVSDLSRTNSEQSVNVDGIEGVDLDASASEVTVRFGDTDDATLTVSGGRGDWTLQREGDALIVRSPHLGFDRWFGGDWFGGEEKVLLTLPESVRSAGIDANLDLSAGSLDLEGDFGDVTIGVGAGSVRAEGSAATLTVDMSAGSSDMEFEGVSEADITVAAGDMDLTLTGTPPETVDIDVSAGSLTMSLPDTEYNLSQNVSAGELDSRLDQASSSERTIDATVSAGRVTLRPGN